MSDNDILNLIKEICNKNKFFLGKIKFLDSAWYMKTISNQENVFGVVTDGGIIDGGIIKKQLWNPIDENVYLVNENFRFSSIPTKQGVNLEQAYLASFIFLYSFFKTLASKHEKLEMESLLCSMNPFIWMSDNGKYLPLKESTAILWFNIAKDLFNEQYPKKQFYLPDILEMSKNFLLYHIVESEFNLSSIIQRISKVDEVIERMLILSLLKSQEFEMKSFDIC